MELDHHGKMDRNELTVVQMKWAEVIRMKENCPLLLMINGTVDDDVDRIAVDGMEMVVDGGHSKVVV